jgi:ABC-type Fe3+/spermidine/putrescine transport system ATPase subunit
MTEFADVKTKYLRRATARGFSSGSGFRAWNLIVRWAFSHIDNFRKNALRRNLFAYLKSEVTCIVATHDSTDALSFADETIVLQHGKLVDKAASYGLYNSPINKYVASFEKWMS